MILLYFLCTSRAASPHHTKLLRLNKVINEIAYNENFDSDDIADQLVDLLFEDSSDEVDLGNYFNKDSQGDNVEVSLSALIPGVDHEKCEFLQTTEISNQLECEDDFLCNEWSCCKDRGGRKRCPPNHPIMCAKPNDCADQTDYCCESDCTNHGGPRICNRRDPTPAQILSDKSSSECDIYRSPVWSNFLVEFEEFVFAKCDSGYFGVGMVKLLPDLDDQQCRPEILDLPFLLNCPQSICKIRLPIRLGLDICDVIGLIATLGMASAYATAARASVQAVRAAVKAMKKAKAITPDILSGLATTALETRRDFKRTQMYAKVGKASAGLCGFIQEAMEKILRCLRAPNWIITLMLKGFDEIKRGFGEIAIEIDMMLSISFEEIFSILQNQGDISDAFDLDAKGWKIQLRLPCDSDLLAMPICLAVAAVAGHPGDVCWNFEVKMEEGKEAEVNCLLVEEPTGAWSLLTNAAEMVFDWEDDDKVSSDSFKTRSSEIKRGIRSKQTQRSCHLRGHQCHVENEPCCGGLNCESSSADGFGTCVAQSRPQRPVRHGSSSRPNQALPQEGTNLSPRVRVH